MTEIHVEMEQDGEWVPVEGIASVEINLDTTALVEQFEQIRCAFQTAAAALIEAAVPAFRALAKAAAEAQHADQSQYALAPARPRPARRPAWQSPYGPPQKGHRR